MTSKTPRVVHCKREPYDVYIGRGKCPITGIEGEWGNPFSCKEHSIAEFLVNTDLEAIFYHKEMVKSDPDMIAKIKRELKGKTLGCWCKPKQCHGDILLEIANS